MDEALSEALAQVVERGAPAQQAEAARLVTILAASPGDGQARAAAQYLVDAYLNDPYLGRR